MSHFLAASELVLNPDSSVYHCNLMPENLADTIFLVGDPGRVPMVSSFFDSVDFRTQKREIVTHTGMKNGKRVSVISTGMGTSAIYGLSKLMGHRALTINCVIANRFTGQYSQNYQLAVQKLIEQVMEVFV